MSGAQQAAQAAYFYPSGTRDPTQLAAAYARMAAAVAGGAVGTGDAPALQGGNMQLSGAGGLGVGGLGAVGGLEL